MLLLRLATCRLRLSPVVDDVDLVAHHNAGVCILVVTRSRQKRGVVRLNGLVLGMFVPFAALLPRLRGDRRRAYMGLILQRERTLSKWIELARCYMLNRVVARPTFFQRG